MSARTTRRPARAAWRRVAFGALLTAALGGCGLVRVFYELPDEQALRAGNDEITWQGHKAPDSAHPTEAILSFSQLVGADGAAPAIDVLKVEGRKLPPMDAAAVAFLHLSDAQVRDEYAYKDPPSRARFATIDPVVSVTVRRPTVEQCDTLTLASFLAAYDQEYQAPHVRSANEFAIHTGDLLDISLMTEMMETMDVFRLVEGHARFPLYSVPGNHDGLTFGNINDEQSDTRGLGINRHEFILAHHTASSQIAFAAADRHPVCPADARDVCDQSSTRQGTAVLRDAFGFGCNEVYRDHEFLRGAFREGSQAAHFDKLTHLGAASAISSLASQIDEAEERRCLFEHGCIEPQTLRNPTVYRRVVHVSGRVDQNAPVSLGYYSWLGAPASALGPQLRFIALDTRSKETASGRMDWVQLGWLYNQLRQALCQHQAVILFAHHPPADVWPSALSHMLDRFPNLVGYFYGHGHVNTEAVWRNAADGFALIQTGSIADYPQVARRVRVWFGSPSGSGTSETWPAGIDWEFVRPRGTATDSGERLDAYLSATRDDSFQEYRSTQFHGVTGPWREWLHDLVPMVSHFESITQAEYAQENLHSGPMAVNVSFADIGQTDPELIFGEEQLKSTNEVRRLLGLDPIRDRCDASPSPESCTSSG